MKGYVKSTILRKGGYYQKKTLKKLRHLFGMHKDESEVELASCFIMNAKFCLHFAIFAY